MPIAFSCNCGKSFQVKDELAGKRTKCPVCGAGLTVPDRATTATGEDEDEAFRLLNDGPEPDQPAAPVRHDWGGQVEPVSPPVSPRPGAKPAPAPKAKARRPAREPREDHAGGGFRITLSPGVAGGLVSMLAAVVWFFLGLEANRIYIYPPIMFCFGLVAVVRGLLGHTEE